MRPEVPLLYLTFDGALEALGHSQVISYLVRLSGRGYRYTLVSLERKANLENANAVRCLHQELADHGIQWVYRPYRCGGSLRSVIANCLAALFTTLRVVRHRKIVLIHTRGYVPTAVAWIVHVISGVPYLFDMRGYWIDERLAEGRWFTHPFVYKLAIRFQRTLLRGSAGIVVLTQIMADDLRGQPLNNCSSKPVAVIPTCADYDEFRPENTGSESIPPELQSRLHRSLVIGWVGSINASYYPHESVLLFRHLLEQVPTAHLLALTAQKSQLEAVLLDQRIPKSAYTIVTVPHNEMACWLSRMDWGLLLASGSWSKRGSMPTKLAEFFASGVRPIQYGCNSEVSEKVQQAGTGLVLSGLSDNELRQAALEIASWPRDRGSTKRGRDLTRDYFGLEAGTDKYATLLDEILREEAT